jgi:pimeloyl-ACP methyl ester carboxylesterase
MPWTLADDDQELYYEGGNTTANARLEVLAEGNHCPMIQRPNWFNEHLRTFARSAVGAEAVTS